MDQSWNTLSTVLDKKILQAIDGFGFSHMTPVQAACIPHFVKNKDVAAEAVTGSGKTLAFIVPLMQILCRRETPLKKHEIGAIILTPTRELAIQIDEVVTHFIQSLTQFSSCLFIGGLNLQTDIEKFTSYGGHVIIATPGRLEDLFSRKQGNFNLAASVKSLELLVLDEADRLLDMGFENSINTILSYLPKQRRTGLFSATQTSEVDKLIRAGLRNPIQIIVKEKRASGKDQKTPMTLKNYYMIVEADDKFNQLVRFLQQHRKEKIMIFFSTCACVDYFSKALQTLLKKSQILAIHSKLKGKRNKTFSSFRQLTSGLLMCTDVMARGVDIPDVHWVIQFDPPSSSSAFVHRCGRTARIGNTGNALVMLLPSEDTYVQFIEINQKVPLTVMSKADDAPNTCPRLQTIAINDRSMYEKGLRAFVSYIQAYAKHECNMILRMKDLNFGKLATGFGLLHLPKMPELKHKKVTDFEPVQVDVSAIPFKDKIREKLRKQKLATQAEGKGTETTKKHKKQTVSWSKQKEKKQKKKDKKERREAKGTKRKREETIIDDSNIDDDDDDDFGEEIRLMKKLKRGKISKEQFDEQFAADMSD